MPPEPLRTRRQVVRAGLLGATVALAGCSGGDDGGAGDGGGDTDAPPADGSDGGDADATESPAEEPTESDGGDETNAAPPLGEAFTAADSYAVDARIESDGRTIAMSGRFADGNTYWLIEQDGPEVELYLVDGESYVVTQGQCLLGTIDDVDENDIDPAEVESGPEATPDVEATGRDTIDGEDVYVHEVSAAEAEDAEEDVTYYVLVDSGYLRRVETASATWNFHSWNEAAPVEKPDMDCRDASSY